MSTIHDFFNAKHTSQHYFHLHLRANLRIRQPIETEDFTDFKSLSKEKRFQNFNKCYARLQTCGGLIIFQNLWVTVTEVGERQKTASFANGTTVVLSSY